MTSAAHRQVPGRPSSAADALQSLGLDVGRGHPRALGGAAQRERTPDPAGGAGDYDQSAPRKFHAHPEYVK